jgi:site-specific DNA recombinase
MPGRARKGQRPDERPYAIYTRLSRKKRERPGQRRARRDDESVERQEREIRAYAVEHGLLVDEEHVYVDPHFSAWKRKGGKRPAWLAMMAVAATGELAGVLIWKLDRFTRAPRDMEDLIDLAEDHHVVIDGPNSGHIDLTTGNGRQQARGAANQAAAESDNTSERVRAAYREARANGEIMGGPRVFGFEYAGDTVHRPAEVALIREAASRMLAGEPLLTIAADFAVRGVVTTQGKPFTRSNLGRMLGRHRYGGFVEHHGQIVGKIPGEPIFDRDTYEGVQAMLTSRRRGRRPTDRFELTGVARCGRGGCGRTLAGAQSTRTQSKGTRSRLYRCPSQAGGCGLAINAEALEKRVRARALELLADPDTRAAIGARDAAQHEARHAAAARLADIEVQLVDLETKKAIGDLIPAAYAAAKPILDRRRDRALAELAEVGSPSSGTLPEVDAADWDDATANERRQIVSRLRMSIVVLPTFADGPRNAIDARRIVITP